MTDEDQEPLDHAASVDYLEVLNDTHVKGLQPRGGIGWQEKNLDGLQLRVEVVGGAVVKNKKDAPLL